jgi:hypothetical protein
MLLLTTGLLLASCGPQDSSRRPAVSLDLTIATMGAAASTVQVGGYVDESPYGKKLEYACQCIGFGCLIGDPGCTAFYFPRVAVTVQNEATGQTTPATLGYSMTALSEPGYQWVANVPLVPGANSLKALASDSKGYGGSASLTVQAP